MFSFFFFELLLSQKWKYVKIFLFYTSIQIDQILKTVISFFNANDINSAILLFIAICLEWQTELIDWTASK